MKTLTRNQLAGRKEKAVRFVSDVLDDPERADEIADESLEDYAERRKIQILKNPHGGNMPRVRLMNPPRISNSRRQTLQPNPQSGRGELLARIRELQQENDELQGKLDKVADLAEAPEGDCDESQNELVDKLNHIIDVVAPEDEDEDDEGND
ncbi:MAG: hypothetical protein LAO19_17525 [Acidobacteriia bacterium]|nr:hypothetical protein [Terriglobia bacterium]